jgi:hypothetical protein
MGSMADTEPNELPIAEPTAAPCRHLRNKGMYVYSDGPDEGTDDEDDHSLYWCLQTMKNFGPDDDLVSGRECRDASRSCYEPL